MQWLKTAFHELFGLFVDDISFAISIVAWLALLWLFAPIVHAEPTSAGVILFVGLAAILFESAWRRARKQEPSGR